MPAFRLFRPDSDPAPQTALAVRDVIAAYLRHSSADGVHSAEARADRERTFQLFCEQCGDVAVDDAKPYLLSDFIAAHPSWKSVSTRRAKANEIRAAFNWAVDEERIARNPFRRVRYAEAERRPDMPDAVLATVATLANKPFERALRWLRLTGCRLSELCEATWEQFDLERGVWLIQRHKARKHTGKARVVVLVPEAVELLRGQRVISAAGAPSDPAMPVLADAVAVPGVAANAVVFRNTRGGSWTRRTLGQQLARMKRRHGIQEKASLHGVRHRVGSATIAAGAPVKLVSQQLGHSTVAVTERYYCDLTGEVEAIRAAAMKGVPK